MTEGDAQIQTKWKRKQLFRGSGGGSIGLLSLVWALVRGLTFVVRVVFDGGIDGFAPRLSAEGIDIFPLGEWNGLRQGLAEIGEGSGGLGLDLSLGDCGEEAAQSGVEIAGGKIPAGEEIRDVLCEFFTGPSLGFFAGVEIAEVRMAGGTGSTTTAAIGKRERTQR